MLSLSYVLLYNYVYLNHELIVSRKGNSNTVASAAIFVLTVLVLGLIAALVVSLVRLHEAENDKPRGNGFELVFPHIEFNACHKLSITTV